MDLTTQIEKSLGDGREYFNVDSKNLQKNIEFIKENKLRNLNLNPYKGYNLKNIDWLAEVPFIKGLEMGACTKINIDGLSALTNLESLIFSAEANQAVDLSGMTKLETLSFEYNTKITGLDKLVNVKHLSVWKADETFLSSTFFGSYKQLSFLKIVQSNPPGSLSFLKENNKLKELEFSHCRTEIDLKGIELLNNSLENLSIVSSKKIKNIELISKLINLKSLILVDSIPLKSTEDIRPLKKLKTLSLYGSSFFENGDLTMLEDKYTHLNIQHKKHYTYPEWYKK